MSYGFEFRDAAGAIRLSINEAMPRVIYQQRVLHSFSGSFSVPEFDSDYGMFYIAPSAVIIFNDDGTTFVTMNPYRAPTLEWNNSTRTMTVTPAQLPVGFPGSTTGSAYWIVFLGLSQRFTVT